MYNMQRFHENLDSCESNHSQSSLVTHQKSVEVYLSLETLPWGQYFLRVLLRLGHFGDATFGKWVGTGLRECYIHTKSNNVAFLQGCVFKSLNGVKPTKNNGTFLCFVLTPLPLFIHSVDDAALSLFVEPGEEGPSLNVVFTNGNQQILRIKP